MGGSVSDRQWRDVVGINFVRGTALDLDYLRASAGNWISSPFSRS
ncbi:MAG: hypothetical protein V9G12_24140 [Microthrixaceae bacterium]